jgi:diguanylate cyclase (GGDEF)-like protein
MNQGISPKGPTATLAEHRPQWPGVLLGRGLHPLQRSYHAVLLQGRVRILAWVLVLAILGWLPIDLLTLSAADLHLVVMLRLALALGCLIVAVFLRGRKGASWSLPLLGIMLLAQCLAFCAIRAWLSPDASDAIRLGYSLFPFVVLAQLALFPLPALHAILLALPLLLIRGGAVALHPDLADGVTGDLWLMALLAAVAVWAAAAQLSLLLGLLEARRDASHDALTGLANRRAALERLSAECARARRSGQPLSALMLDLDHFKRVNDTWGHAVGDQVLVEAARILRSELRGADLGVRFGGEEFLALLPGTDLEAAVHVAERIRQRMAEARIALGSGAAVAITLSVGAACLQPDESGDGLVQRADAALYQAKALGRNRVERADAGRPTLAAEAAAAG